MFPLLAPIFMESTALYDIFFALRYGQNYISKSLNFFIDSGIKSV